MKKLKELSVKKLMGYKDTHKSPDGSYASTENSVEVIKTYEIDGEVDMEAVAKEIEEDVVKVLRVGPAWMLDTTREGKMAKGEK